MKENLSFYFESSEFKEILSKYKAMQEDNSQVYFDADQLTDIAEYFADCGMIKESNKAIEYGLEIHPNNTNLLIHKVRYIAYSGNTSKARKLLNSIEEQNDREVQFLKAELYLDECYLEEANQIFTELYEEENSMQCILDIYNIYTDHQKMEDAIKWLHLASKKNPENPTVNMLFGNYYSLHHEKEKALAYYNKSLDKEPYSIECWYNIAKCYFYSDNFEEAINALDYCLAIDPNDVPSLKLKGKFLVEMNNYEEGTKFLSKAEKLAKDGSTVRLILIECYISMKKYEEAITLCKKHREAKNADNFDIAQASAFEALAYAYLNKFDEAFKALEYGIKADSNLSSLYIAKGEIFLLQNKIIEAQNEFSYAEHIAFDKQENLYTILISCMKCGFYPMALQYFKKLEEQYPNENSTIYHLIAYCHYMEGNKEKMMEYIKKSIEESKYTFEELIAAPELANDEDFIKIFEEIIKEINNNPYLH